jgi:hypothetical protein
VQKCARELLAWKSENVSENEIFQHVGSVIDKVGRIRTLVAETDLTIDAKDITTRAKDSRRTLTEEQTDALENVYFLDDHRHAQENTLTEEQTIALGMILDGQPRHFRITGPPGSGKTLVALKALLSMHDPFRLEKKTVKKFRVLLIGSSLSICVFIVQWFLKTLIRMHGPESVRKDTFEFHCHYLDNDSFTFKEDSKIVLPLGGDLLEIKALGNSREKEYDLLVADECHHYPKTESCAILLKACAEKCARGIWLSDASQSNRASVEFEFEVKTIELHQIARSSENIVKASCAFRSTGGTKVEGISHQIERGTSL